MKPGDAYGFCPKCGAPGIMRERRPNGNDRCANGHEYPSREAVRPAAIVEPLTTPEGERVHVLKADLEPFRAVWAGRKLFEFRSIRDRDFRVGDFVLLRETIGGGTTGRSVLALIPYILPAGSYGVPDGFAILSLEVMVRTTSDRDGTVRNVGSSAEAERVREIARHAAAESEGR